MEDLEDLVRDNFEGETAFVEEKDWHEGCMEEKTNNVSPEAPQEPRAEKVSHVNWIAWFDCDIPLSSDVYSSFS